MWHRVADRLPEHGKYVLVLVDGNWRDSTDDPRRKVAKLTERGWQDFGPGLGGMVTHWHDLPAVPEDAPVIRCQVVAEEFKAVAEKMRENLIRSFAGKFGYGVMYE